MSKPAPKSLRQRHGKKRWCFYTDRAHGLCNSHHLRELIFLTERYPQAWQTGMIALLLEIKASVEQVRQKQPHLPAEQQTRFEQRYDRLIEEGLNLNPLPEQKEGQAKKRGRVAKSPPRNLLERLRDHKEACWRFFAWL